MLSVVNMSSLFVFILFAPLYILTLAIMNKVFPFWKLLPKKIDIFIQSHVDQYIKDTFWNSTLKFMDENYLVLTVSNFIQLHLLKLNPKTNHWSAVFSSSVGIFGSTIVVIFPVIVFVVYALKFKSTAALPDISEVEEAKWEDTYGTTDREEILKVIKENFTRKECVAFIERYGALLKGTDVSRMGKWTSIMVPVVSLVRRLLMALVITFMYDKPVFSIIAFVYITKFYIMFFAWNMPY